MVVASPNPIIATEKIIETIELPVIDLSMGERSEVSNLVVRACEKYGFFKVINHGISKEITSRMEQESMSFFAKPFPEKELAGPANPFGYGCKNIGFNGDIGDVEYLLLNTHPLSISQRSKTISDDPHRFRYSLLPIYRYIYQLLLRNSSYNNFSCHAQPYNKHIYEEEEEENTRDKTRAI